MQRLKRLWTQRSENLLILVIGITLAILLRISFLDFKSADFVTYVGPWYDYIRSHGGFLALKSDFSNYTPFYLYMLAGANYVFPGLRKLYAIKLISIAFDFLCAFFVFKTVRLKYPKGSLPFFAFFTVLFAPTIVFNSSLWGQVDIIYTTGLVACVYFLAIRKQIPAFVALGLALAFKQQAVFLIPLCLALALNGTVSWRNFVLIPVIYVITILPAWFLGRPIYELLSIYINQANYYNVLTANAPNVYQWFPQELYKMFIPAGLVWTAAVVLFLLFGIYRCRTKIDRNTLVQLATFTVLLVPYLLPKMHERYFFAADVFSVVYAFFFPQYFFVPLVVGAISLLCYLPFLFDVKVIPLPILAIVLLVIIVILCRRLATTLMSTPTDELQPHSYVNNHMSLPRTQTGGPNHSKPGERIV